MTFGRGLNALIRADKFTDEFQDKSSDGFIFSPALLDRFFYSF
jgi:hypothetical protein